MTGFDTSVETLQRLVGELRWLTPPALTNGVLDQICEELESVIGLGSPVAGYSSWSAKERPDIGGAFLMDLVPPCADGSTSSYRKQLPGTRKPPQP